MNRFFTDEITENKALIHGDDVKHISRVLRLKAGDPVSICDGKGTDYSGTIDTISDQEVVCVISNPVPSPSESACRVDLYQGLPKSGKMELIIQKCVEMGINSITPVLMKRCVPIPSKDFEKKRVRYQRISLEAAKQSKRGIIPDVCSLISLKDLDSSRYDAILIAYEDEKMKSLKDAIRGFSGIRIAIVIGPEGGLEEAEVNMLKEKGAISVSLGNTILRTETAGLVMTAQIMYELA